MKKFNWLLGAILAALGLLVIIFPSFWIKIIVVLFGAAAIAYGVYNIIFAKTVLENTKFANVILVKSVLSIMVGTLAVVLPLAFANAVLKIMMIILAVYLIVAAGLGFYSVSLLKDTGVDRKKYVWENLVLLIAGILLFLISPEKLGSLIVRIIGIVSLAAGAVLLILEFGFKKKKEVIVTVEETEIKDAVEPENEDSSGEEVNNDAEDAGTE